MKNLTNLNNTLKSLLKLNLDNNFSIVRSILVQYDLIYDLEIDAKKFNDLTYYIIDNFYHNQNIFDLVYDFKTQ